MTLQKLADAMIEGDVETGKSEAQKALDEGYGPNDILDNGVLAGMEVVSERFKNYEMYIPEVLSSAKVMHEVMDIIRPKLVSESDESSKGTVVLGTVEGDMHDIGKNLVGLMLEGAGFKVIDIGIDQPAQSFVNAVKKEKPEVVGMSALLTTTAPKIKEVLDALEKEGLKDGVKTIAGGAVIDQKFVDENGVDAYGPSATDAIDITQELVKEVRNNAS